MTKRFVVFMEDSEENTDVVLRETESAVLALISADTTINSIMLINERGTVVHYDPVIRQGRLKLEIIPQMG